MNLGFVSYIPFVYKVDTPYKEPLGGSESCMCYLAEELAKRGHKVTLFVRYPKPFRLRGVYHQPIENLKNTNQTKLDFLVLQNTASFGPQLRGNLNPKTKLIFWAHHAEDQAGVQRLQNPRFWQVFDSIVFVSRWQMENYINAFAINLEKCFIIRNAASPFFQNLFTESENVLSYKRTPPVIAYTATPFRGLEVLIKLFPQIRSLVPGTRLKVYSSMKLYQATQAADEKDYGKLYKACKNTDGVDYIGAVPQKKLAQELKKTFMLSYPNTFPETSCISAMEAMAAGCQIVTSRLGALPETTTGFAKLIPPGKTEDEYSWMFVNETVSLLRQLVSGNTETLSDNLARQVIFANNNYTWKKRAEEWENWLLNH